MLGDRATDFDHRRLLKGIAADQSCRHLSGNRDHGDTVHLRVGNRRHKIRRAGTTCPHTNANAICRPGNTLCSETTTLFVTRKNRPDIRTPVRQRLVQRHAASARIRENDVRSLADEAFDKDIGPVQRSRFGGQRQAGGDSRHDQIPSIKQLSRKDFLSATELASAVALNVRNSLYTELPRFESSFSFRSFLQRSISGMSYLA